MSVITEVKSESITGRRRVHYTATNPQRPGLGHSRVRMTERSDGHIVIDVTRVSVTGHAYSVDRVDVTKASVGWKGVRERFDSLCGSR